MGRALAAMALSIAAAIGISGCPALLLPGLVGEAGYEAYKFNTSKSESPQPSSVNSQSTTGAKKKHKKKHKKKPQPGHEDPAFVVARRTPYAAI